MDYAEFLKEKKEIDEIKQARVRGWGVWVSHLLLAPLASVTYSARTNYWLPTIVASGVALAGIPFAIVDFGLVSAVGAPLTSAGMIVANTMNKRVDKGFLSPEQADAALLKKL